MFIEGFSNKQILKYFCLLVVYAGFYINALL